MITKQKKNIKKNKHVDNFRISQPISYKNIIVNPYDFSAFNSIFINGYENYKKQNKTWKDSIKQSSIDSYQKLFGRTDLYDTTNIPRFIDKMIATIGNIVKDDNDDVKNWVVFLSGTFVLQPYDSYKYYIIEPFDANTSYYMNISISTDKTECTLADLFDVLIKKQLSCYLPDTVYTQLENKNIDYKTLLSTIKININDVRIPVSYNYINPTDIFTNSSRYTFSGIGISDNQQPEFVVLVDKSQFQYLNRLLKNSDANTKIPIHSWFPMYDYTIVWKDEWSGILENYYKNSIINSDTKTAFIKSLNYLLLQQNSSFQNIPLTFTSLSQLLTIVPPTFYWMITLIGLLDSVQFKYDLFYYPKFPGRDQQQCRTNCYSSCIKNFDNSYEICVNNCPSQTAAKCGTSCIIEAMYDKLYFCSKHLNETPILAFQSVGDCITQKCIN